ncbi:hypothetical protein ACKWTF_015752 [Chironomus riparius]
MAQKIILAVLLVVACVHGEYDIYEGCGTTKQCLGNPGDCVPDKDCVTMSSTYVKDGKVIFEMRSWKSAKYIAMGLSTDKEMGDDSVMECVKEGDEIKAYSSWTVVGANYASVREGIPQDIITLVDSKIIDGRIYCQVERVDTVKIKKTTFDLTKKPYYMMLASGDTLRENGVDYHNLAYVVTKKKINFKP